MRGCLASLVMLFVPLFLWWLPVPGLAGFLGGLFGGLLLGGAMRSFMFVVVPFIVLSLLIVAVGFFTPLPLLGPIVASVLLVWFVMTNLGLLLGAFVGGGMRTLTDGGPRKQLR